MPALAIQMSRHVRLAGLATLGAATAIISLHIGWQPNPEWLNGYLSPGLVPSWVLISAIIFVAAAVSSTVGFAFSAIAGAMIFHCVPNAVEAVEIMMIASIGLQLYSVADLYRSIAWSRCTPFIAGGIAALPFGVLLLLHLETRIYALAMGAALMVYGLYMLLRPPVLIRTSHRVPDVLIGALGGITGPLAAFPGACVTIWCGMRGWDKVAQRAVYQPYILVMQILALCTLCLLQQRSTFDPALLAYAAPGVAGASIGLRVFRAISDLQFQRTLNLALVASGIALVLK